MPEELLSKAAFALKCGVSRAAITKACREDGPLFDALENGRINLGHPNARRYMKNKGVSPSSPPRPAATTPSADHADVEDYLSMTLSEIILKHGTDEQFKNYLTAVKTLAEISEKQMKVAERRGQLVPREFVERYLMAFIETAFSRLLSDVPTTLASRVRDASLAGEALESIEQIIRREMSKTLKPQQEKAVKSLANYGNK